MCGAKLRLSLVNFSTILDCNISKKVNEHGTVMISGYIQSEEEEQLIHRNTDIQFAKIEIVDEWGKERSLFSGVVTSIRIEQVGDLKKAEIKLMGGTYLLEGVLHTRTFQNQSMTYEQLLTNVEKEVGASHILKVDNKAIGELVVQYKETDWDFIKRLASHFNTCIVPYYKAIGIKYFFGLGSGEMHSQPEIISYSIQSDINDSNNKRKNGVEDIVSGDSCYYILKSREIFDLGDGIMFKGTPLYVYSVESRYIGAEMIHTYWLKRAGGFLIPRRYNFNLIGASLDATILSVAGDKVKACVNVDGFQNEASAKWFPYSTVYSSPDGSGWYCMPEPNDSVRLYFPSEKEREGYVISSIHVDNPSSDSNLKERNLSTSLSNAGENAKPHLGSVSENASGKSRLAGNDRSGNATNKVPPRSNPDNKSISNKEGKLIELTPTSILITNNKGMSVILDDEEGISIISDKDVLIQSEEDVTIRSTSESMFVEAVESIELVQGNTKITMKDDVMIEGAKFKLQ